MGLRVRSSRELVKGLLLRVDLPVGSAIRYTHKRLNGSWGLLRSSVGVRKIL